jgi:membrane protein
MHAPRVTIGRLRDDAQTVPARELIREIAAAYGRNDLLTAASAIAFQLLFALIPLALFACGLLGFLGLEDLYSRELAPKLQQSTSSAAFEVIDSTIRNVLGRKQGFWITMGLVIAVWEMSGATRAVMGTFDRIYACRRRRTFTQRYAVSIALAIGTGALFLLATATFIGAPLVGGLASALRWPVSAALLLVAMALFVRFGASDPQPLRWVSIGSLLVVVAWLGTSVAFAVYVRDIADYGSIFGALAVVIVAFEYFYLAAIAFLTGAQMDALIRERAEAS